MSNISLVIEERAADIGSFMVGRILPFRKKRSVGPFVFFDHMGPATLGPGENLDVLPHPHIGLSTLTYLFEGSIIHRDSLGSVQEIKPGAVNWMTAGKGVVHSERTPDDIRNRPKTLHGFQIWVSLPKELEETEPAFHHIPEDEIPVWQDFGVSIKLIAGEISGKKSRVPVYSKLYFMELSSTETKTINFGGDLYGEAAIYILSGNISINGEKYGSKRLLIPNDNKLGEFVIGPESTVYILGGETFTEKRFINWNFVSSSPERIDKAKKDWINRKFPEIPGEKGFVPYPQSR